MTFQINWTASFDTIDKAELKEGKSLLIEGTLIDTNVNSNKWAIDDDELDNIVGQVAGSQLRKDHGASIDDIIGGMIEGTREGKKIKFKAEVDDLPTITKILKNRLNSVSVGMTAQSSCSSCGKPIEHLNGSRIKKCECKDFFEKIKNSILRETSIVANPAYETTKFEPIGFVAGVEKVLSEPITVISEEVKGGEVSVDDTQKPSPATVVKVEGSSGSKNKEERKEMSVKKDEAVKKESEEEDEAKKEEVELKPAGPDSVVLLGKKIDELCRKMDELGKKFDGFGPVKVIPPEQIEQSVSKKDEDEEEEEAVKVKVKKEKKQPEEEEEEEEETKKPAKKEIVKGAKVDTSQDIEASAVSVEATGYGPAWDKAWAELKAAAKKFEIIP